MKNKIKLTTSVLFLCVIGLCACTKYADPELAGSDLAGKICSLIHSRCNPNPGEVSTAEFDCNDKLKAEITTYMQANSIKISQDQMDLCLNHAEFDQQDCQEVLKGNIAVPEGCEAFSDWYNK